MTPRRLVVVGPEELDTAITKALRMTGKGARALPKEMIVLCGLVGAGKSTFYEKFLGAYPRVDVADAHKEIGLDDFFENARRAVDVTLGKARELFDTGHDVVVYEALNLTEGAQVRLHGFASVNNITLRFVWISVNSGVARQRITKLVEAGDEEAKKRLEILDSVVDAVVKKELFISKPRNRYEFTDPELRRIGDVPEAIW